MPSWCIVFFLYFGILLIGRLPESPISDLRLHAFDFLLYLSILGLPLPLLLLPEPITLPKLPLKAIIPRIIPLHTDFLPASDSNGCQSLLHVFIPNLNLISHIKGEIPIASLRRNMIDSSTQRILEFIYYLRPCILYILIMMCLVLKIHIELRLLRRHPWTIIIWIILCRQKDLVDKIQQ